MSWEYSALKRDLGVRPSGALRLFEWFCERAWGSLLRLEWSCKIERGVTDAHRFVACARSQGMADPASPFQKLLASAGFDADTTAGGDAPLQEALVRYATTVFVAVTGGGSDGRPTLKAYVGWRGGGADLDAHLLDLPPRKRTLPGEPIRMIGRSIDQDGRVGDRTYVLYDEPDHGRGAVRGLLRRELGASGARLAALHPRAGIARKPGPQYALLAGLRPTGVDAPHPSHAGSPLLIPVVQAAREIPALRERLSRITWIAASLDVLTIRVGEMPSQLGVYTRLVN